MEHLSMMLFVIQWGISPSCHVCTVLWLNMVCPMANAKSLPESHHGASLPHAIVLPLNVSRQMLKVSQNPTARLVAVRAFDRKVVVADAVVLVERYGSWRPRAGSLLNRRWRCWRRLLSAYFWRWRCLLFLACVLLSALRHMQGPGHVPPLVSSCAILCGGTEPQRPAHSPPSSCRHTNGALRALAPFSMNRCWNVVHLLHINGLPDGLLRFQEGSIRSLAAPGKEERLDIRWPEHVITGSSNGSERADRTSRRIQRITFHSCDGPVRNRN
jgi:hypothetical protein